MIPAVADAIPSAAVLPTTARRSADALWPLVALALLLLTLVGLGRQGTFVSRFWADRSLAQLWLQLGAIFAGACAVRLAPARLRKWVLVGEGALVLAGYGWPEAPLYGALLVAAWAITELPLPRPLALGTPLALFIAALVIGGRAHDHRVFVFSMLFWTRLLVYLWEKWQRYDQRVALGDYLFYAFSPVLLLIPSFMIFIPFFGGFHAAARFRFDDESTRRGLRHVALAVVYALLRVRLEAWHPLDGIVPLALVYATRVVYIAGVAHLAYGLLVLHGIEERLPFDAPLLARDFNDYWSRFQRHQRDAQVALFYTPVLLRLRRCNRYGAILLATAAAILAGNPVLHLGRDLFQLEHTRHQLGMIFGINLAYFVLLAASLCLRERHRRHPPRAGWRRAATGVAVRVAAVGAAIVLFVVEHR